MPRRKQLHRFEVVYPPVDADLPLASQRAIYTRLSDDDPDSVSHQHQQEAAERYAEAHGYVITAIYRDWRTGLDPDRLAFKQLIDDAHGGKHGGVIFWDHYRLHRGVRGAYPVDRLHHELPMYVFEATVGGYDIDQVGIWAGISGMEVATTRRRTMEERRQRAKRGELVAGKVPYWLTRDPKTREPVLVPNRADAMRKAIAQYAGGTPMLTIVRWFNTNAPVDPKHPKWSSDRLRKSFRNPALWGELDFGRVKVRTERRNGDIVVVGRDVNPDAVPFRVPPLLHKTELDRAECQLAGGCERDPYPAGETLDQLIRDNSTKVGGRPWNVEHPLRRRVVCACGWRMSYRPKRYKGKVRDYGSLRCARTIQQGHTVVHDYPPCPTPSIATRLLWPKVQRLVVEAIEHPDVLVADVQAQILADAAKAATDDASAAETVESLTQALAELDERENRLYEDFRVQNLISETVFRAQTARIARERRESEEAKRQILSRRLVVQQAERATARLREGLRRAGALPLERLTLADWAELLGALVEDVVLDANGTPRLSWRRGL